MEDSSIILKDRPKTSNTDDLIIENTSQHLKDEVNEALSTRRSAHLNMLAISEENAFSPELREEFSQLRRRVARTMGGPGFDEELEGELRTAAIKKSETISQIIENRAARLEAAAKIAGIKWSDLNVAPPQPVDNSYWWAFTNWHLGSKTQAVFRDDGLHFWAGPNIHGGEMHTSFGAVATFALQPERFPGSPSGMFRSSPHVELTGGVVAYAPDYDILQGNGIAECKLFLRQTIFQFGIGPTGPTPIMIAEAKGDSGWFIHLKNTGYDRHKDLPGFTAIPEVTYGQSQLNRSDLFAEVEFRLDIYLDSAGASVWCDPEVLFRTIQWSPTPLP
jgi:hypothetical protein